MFRAERPQRGRYRQFYQAGAEVFGNKGPTCDAEMIDMLLRYLDELGTPYVVEPRLVRGLDYYTRTLFEIKAAKEKLGAGSTVVGGGRYDRMIEELGGPSVPAISFAAGIERLLLANELAT